MEENTTSCAKQKISERKHSSKDSEASETIISCQRQFNSAGIGRKSKRLIKI